MDFKAKETLAQAAMRIDNAALQGLSGIQMLELAYKMSQFKKPDRPDDMDDFGYKIYSLQKALIYRDKLVTDMKVPA